MIRRDLEHCGGLSGWKVFLYALALAVGIELLTVWARFGLGLQSTRDTWMIGMLTLGLRIHHGYLGLGMVLAAGLFARSKIGLFKLGLIVGLALILSDLVHHFLVLWSVTGSPEFDLFYPVYTS